MTTTRGSAFQRVIDTILSHKWWAGISGVLAGVAIIIPLIMSGGDEAPVGLAETSGAGASVGPNGSCNAVGSGNSVFCVPGTSATGGVSYFRATWDRARDLGTDYVVPLSAPLESLPTGDGGGLCTEEQQAWLRKYGTELHGSLSVGMRNAAAGGAILSLRNLRVEEFREEPAQPNLWFACPTAGAADAVVVQMDFTKRGKLTYQLDDGPVMPGAAFSFNLAPGESGTLLVHPGGLDQTYSGKLVVTLQYGDESRDVALPLGPDPRFHRPGVGRSKALVVAPSSHVSSDFTCTDSSGEHGCSMNLIRARLTELWKPVLPTQGMPSTGRSAPGT